jgi:pyruvate dehydrogenase E2 component (dihydrolipoamide acetyltransferase)
MAIDIVLPDLGENIQEGGVLEIRVKPGDTVGPNDIVIVLEAEKSTVEVPAGIEGKIAEIVVNKGQMIKPGAVLARVEGSAATSATKPAAKAAQTDSKAAPVATKTATAVAPPAGHNGESVKTQPRFTPDQLTPAGPATRRLARKFGINLSQVHGSGPRGRVTQDDVIAFAQRSTGGGVAAPPLPDFTKWGEIEERPLEMIRRKTGEQMSISWSQIPHVTQHDLADITDLDAFRRTQEGQGPKLTVTAFALKACAVAIKEFPQFNSSLDVAGNKLIVKRYCHIGVAVDTEWGLLVPVIRDVDKKSIRDLATDLADVAERARARKLPIEEMKGGCFTISNLGGIGGTGFSPIVNWPEVAILGLSRSRTEPVFQNGQFAPRLMMPLSLSYDHRVIDGAAGARFTRRVASLLENPMLLLVEA